MLTYSESLKSERKSLTKDPPSQVVMKIVKHCSASFPTAATGSLVGMDNDGLLEVTNTFPFPTADLSGLDSAPGSHQSNDASSLAAAAPRAKANIVYQNDMIRHLKEVNVDANNVGWYTSAAMGNFVNIGFIENQYHYQRENDKAIALVHDVSRSSQGALSLRAFRLTPNFVNAYKEGKFTTERYGLLFPLHPFTPLPPFPLLSPALLFVFALTPPPPPLASRSPSCPSRISWPSCPSPSTTRISLHRSSISCPRVRRRRTWRCRRPCRTSSATP